MTSIQLFVFDLAGTTIQDQQEVPNAFRDALAKHQLNLSNEDLKRFRGLTKREVIKNLLDDDNRTEVVYQSFLRRLRNYYEKTGVQEVHGASDLFQWLRSKGMRVALNTGFDRSTTEWLLQRIGWNDQTFDVIVCGDEARKGRPAPDLILKAMKITGIESPAEVANVGDTPADLHAGHNAGVRWNIGVLSGAGTKEALEHAPHTHLLNSIADLRALCLGG